MPDLKQDVEKASRPRLSTFAGPQMTVGQKSKTFKQAFGTPTGADPQSGRPTYMRSGVLTKSGKPKKATKYRGKLTPDERVAKVKAKIDKENPTMIGASGKPIPVPQEEPGMKGLKGLKKKTQRSIAKATKQPLVKSVVGAGKDTLKFARKKPFSAAVVASTVIDALRGAPKIPKPPTPKGGKVGRRTAG